MMTALQEFRPSHGQPIETNRWPGILFAGLLHILAIYALATGLPYPTILPVAEKTHAIVTAELPKSDDLPPPLPVDFKPPPVVAVVPEVEISLSRVPPPAATVTSPPAPAVIVHAPTGIVPQTPPIPITSHAVTSDDYPDLSVRVGEEGVVKIKYLVQVDGTVGECAVITSSGSARLDGAACAMVKRRWRFSPATEKGKPVAAYLLADVSFTILPVEN